VVRATAAGATGGGIARREGRAGIVRQLFDSVSSTCSYLITSRHGGEALIMDPVFERVGRYRKLLEEFNLKLVTAVSLLITAHGGVVTGSSPAGLPTFRRAGAAPPRLSRPG
jgi:hypothetical protein